MAIEIISVSSGNNANFTHTTPSGLTNSVLVVGVGTHQGTITGVTYNGVSMTQIDVGTSAFTECGYVFLLLNPASGENTVSITRSGGSWHGAHAITLQGVKQTTTVTHNKVDSGSGSSATITVTPPAGNVFIFAATGSDGDVFTGAYSPASANYSKINNSSFENEAVVYYVTKTGVPQMCSMTINSGQRYGIAVLCLVEPDNSALEFIGYRHIEVGNGMSRSEGAT